MGAVGLERGFAMVVGAVLLLLGMAGVIGSPLAGSAEDSGLFVTGFGHDLVHLVTGALFLHVGVGLTGRERAYGLAGLGVFFLLTGLLSLLSSDLLGVYDAPASGLDQLMHILLGLAAVVMGWMGRGVERREFGRAASRPIPR